MTRSNLVVGASGLIGSHLLAVFGSQGPTMGTYCEHVVEGLQYLDMSVPDQVSELVEHLKPSVVLCPGGKSYSEFCELNPTRSRQVNVVGLSHLVSAARRINARFVYFSSDWVFDGRKGFYGEEDLANPINEYGRQKVACEQIIQDVLKDCVIVRTSAVYGWERQGKNFVMRLVQRLRCGERTEVPRDQVLTPTYVNNLALAVKELVETDRQGIYHLAGTTPMIRYEFALLVAEIFGLDPNLIIPVATTSLRLAMPRPPNTGLKIEKAQSLLKVGLLSPREGLTAMRAAEPGVWGKETGKKEGEGASLQNLR